MKAPRKNVFKVLTIVRVSVDMATYVKALLWVNEHCRDPAPNGALVIACGHVEDVGPTIVVEVGRNEFKLDHPLASKAWKSFEVPRPCQFCLKPPFEFEDGSPIWIYQTLSEASRQ